MHFFTGHSVLINIHSAVQRKQWLPELFPFGEWQPVSLDLKFSHVVLWKAPQKNREGARQITQQMLTHVAKYKP